jgi:hypothetical protein
MIRGYESHHWVRTAPWQGGTHLVSRLQYFKLGCREVAPFFFIKRTLGPLLAFLLSVTGIAAPVAAGAEPLKLDLSIIIETTVKKKNQKKAYYDTWGKACREMKFLLENRSDKIGHGPFQKVKCYFKPTRLDKAASSQKTSWVLRVSDNNQQTGFEIFYVGGGKKLVEAQLMAGSSEKFVKILGDKTFLKNAMLILTDQLPMFSIAKLSSSMDTVEVADDRLWSDMPQKVAFYTLSFDKGTDSWQTRVVGQYQPPKTAPNGQKGAATWQIQIHRGVLREGEPLFVHNSAGRGMASQAAMGVVKDYFSKLGMDFSEMLGSLLSMTSNFSGVRYGYPMLKPGNVISKTSFISAFAELRSGFLGGLRFYYDAAPKATFTDQLGSQEYFQWSRLNLGWAFSLPLKGKELTLDLQPKIGRFSLDGKLMIYDENNIGYPVVLLMKNATNIGLEVGLEYNFIKGVMTRGWGSFNRSFESKKSSSATDFTSFRGGIDFYRDIYSFKRTKIQGLIFGAADYLILGQAGTSPVVASGTENMLQIGQVSYRLYFIGAGATIAW